MWLCIHTSLSKRGEGVLSARTHQGEDESMSRSMPAKLLRLALLTSAALPGGALAQEATEVAEVTVTAQKRTQDLLDVGGSVSVVAAEQVAGRRVEQVRDLAALTPNLD